MKRYIYLTFGILTSCTIESNNSEDSKMLIESSKQVAIGIDSYTRLYCNCIRYYKEDSTEYIILRRELPKEIYDEIIFFDLEQKLESYSVKVFREGPNAIIGGLYGYDVINKDSIVLSSKYMPILYLINSDGTITNQFVLDSIEGITESLMLSSNNLPFVKNHNIIDFPQNVPYTRIIHRPNPKDFKFSDCPLAYLINIETRDVIKSEASFPHLYDNNDRIYHSEGKSRAFDGENYVYSFHAYDSIIVTSNYIDTKNFVAKSRYMEAIENKGVPVGATNNEIMKGNLEAHYGNILYDKYRSVYYRFCYHEDNYKGPQNIDYLMSGGAFSIIIINEDFKVVGETLFPSGKYAPRLFFVNKDGLWLSENNFQREGVSDDILSFRCLTLEDISDEK